MTSVESLLASLRHRTQEFVIWQKTSTSCPIDSWWRLARNAARVLELVDGPTELGPILRQLAATGQGQTDGEETPLTGVALTVGVLADTLDSAPSVARTASVLDRSQLRSSLLASLHSAAQASVAGVATLPQHAPGFAMLRDLADSTEAASHVPRRPLQGELSFLRIGPEPGSLDEAVSLWAVKAKEILNSPTRATKYAFQRTAASIARFCWVAASDLVSIGEQRGEVPRAAASLFAAFKSWKIAADWPSELRLDGRSGELRECSQYLDQAFSAWCLCARSGSLPVLFSALLIAGQVGALHEEALLKRIVAGGLWIVGEALGPSYLTRHPGTHRSGWLPDPGSQYSAGLIRAVERANLDLRVASRDLRLAFLHRPTNGRSDSVVWESVTTPHHASAGEFGAREISTNARERIGARIDRPLRH